MDKTLSKPSKNSFEELEIWKLGIQLFLDISTIFKKDKFKDYYFKDQILRATLSISNNIAEGYERQSNKELMHFLYIAKGSCGEVRSMLHIAEQQKFITLSESEKLRNQCMSLSVKTNNLIRYLATH